MIEELLINRDDILMMARVKDEGRWIGLNLARTWPVCGKVLIWDDGSTDDTEFQCVNSTDGGVIEDHDWGLIARNNRLGRTLYYLRSPFRGTARADHRASEIRDRNLLWAYAKSEIAFRHVLCLDGDEALSKNALMGFPEAIEALERPDGPHMISMPFVYLWDAWDKQRVDGIYGNAEDGFKRLRFPRLFTLRGLTDEQVFHMHFAWKHPGGIHCGSIPQQEFRPGGQLPVTAFMNLPVIHYGYLEDAMRRAKFEFYSRIDPNNSFEGFYRHVVGEPDVHAPGPVELAPWEEP